MNLHKSRIEKEHDTMFLNLVSHPKSEAKYAHWTVQLCFLGWLQFLLEAGAACRDPIFQDVAIIQVPQITHVMCRSPVNTLM